jgi:hypothetical protein
MNEPLLAASILSALAAVLHGGLGEAAIFRAAVRTPLPQLRPPSAFAFLAAQTAAANTEIQWRYLRTTWHLLTIDFSCSTVLFAVCAFTPAPALVLVVRFTAIRYATYAIAWLVFVALHHRSIFRAPQWALLLAIAGCAWLG